MTEMFSQSVTTSSYSTRDRNSDQSWNLWLALVLLGIFFTPTIRLPGEIPLRVEDVLIFGTGLIGCCRVLFTLRIKKTEGPWLYLAMVPLSILLCTAVVALSHQYPVGIKEYLDLLRPVKFLIVFLVLAHGDQEASQRTFTSVAGISMIALAAIALFQLAFMKIDSNGILARFFLMYSELEEEHARTMLAMRPFATFNTPTDLGYISTIGVFVGLVLARGHRRKWIIGASLLALAISETRTFLFSLPLLLVAEAWMGAGSVRQALRKLRAAFVLAFCGLVFLLGVMRTVSAAGYGMMQNTTEAITTGNMDQEESITNRLNNIALAEYTWEHARWFGVVTRSMLGPAADSELLYIFHRYGLVGLTMLLTFYAVGYMWARRFRSRNPQFSHFAIMVLLITFIYGITQGAIINTRIGVIPFAVLGILSCRKGDEFGAERDMADRRGESAIGAGQAQV
jgi:uncharacterized membrane protein YhaH (DUF805 family)